MMLSQNRNKHFGVGALALAFGAAIYSLSDYFIPSIQIILGLLVLPFLLMPKNGSKTLGYFILACLLLVLNYFIPFKLFSFLFWGILILGIAEHIWGSLGYLPPALLLALSPTLKSLVNLFSFPLRMQMSEHVSSMLSLVGWNIRLEGSAFRINETEVFHVDTACLGLSMLNTSLFFALLVLGYREKQRQQHFKPWLILLFMLLVLALWLVANYLRIMGIVALKSPPDSFGHEMIGLLSILVYIMLPIWFISYAVIRASKKVFWLKCSNRGIYSAKQQRTGLSFAYGFVFVGFLFLNQWTPNNGYSSQANAFFPPLAGGYTISEAADEALAFRNDEALILVKKEQKPWESGHPPEICWKSEGFELEQFQYKNWGQHQIMVGQMRKQNQVYYTAWWYDNGINKTALQSKWRLDPKGGYRVINVTCSSQELLNKYCSQWITLNWRSSP